ncbi:hypothetical protein GGP77_002909, partial [Salinibacter ruber]|nr:hypothetical protein [Salinibacter ruber]
NVRGLLGRRGIRNGLRRGRTGQKQAKDKGSEK